MYNTRVFNYLFNYLLIFCFFFLFTYVNNVHLNNEKMQMTVGFFSRQLLKEYSFETSRISLFQLL